MRALSFRRSKKLSISPLDRPHEVCYNIKLLRGISAVGSAPQWHCGGQGFDSLMLHSPQKPNLFLQRVRFFYFEMNRAHAHSHAAACTDFSAKRHANAVARRSRLSEVRMHAANGGAFGFSEHCRALYAVSLTGADRARPARVPVSRNTLSPPRHTANGNAENPKAGILRRIIHI